MTDMPRVRSCGKADYEHEGFSCALGLVKQRQHSSCRLVTGAQPSHGSNFCVHGAHVISTGGAGGQGGAGQRAASGQEGGGGVRSRGRGQVCAGRVWISSQAGSRKAWAGQHGKKQAACKATEGMFDIGAACNLRRAPLPSSLLAICKLIACHMQAILASKGHRLRAPSLLPPSRLPAGQGHRGSTLRRRCARRCRTKGSAWGTCQRGRRTGAGAGGWMGGWLATALGCFSIGLGLLDCPLHAYHS